MASNSENFRMFTRFIYLCLFWFCIVYLHPGFVYLHFSMFVYRISALFTNTGLFICTFNVYIQSFRLVYKHCFVYLRFLMFVYPFSALFTNTGLFIYIFQCLYTEFPPCLQTPVCLFTFSNVCIQSFRFVYKHWFVYLHLLCLFTSGM